MLCRLDQSKPKDNKIYTQHDDTVLEKEKSKEKRDCADSKIVIRQF